MQSSIPWFSSSHYAALPVWDQETWFRALSCRMANQMWIDEPLLDRTPQELTQKHFEAIATHPDTTDGRTYHTPGRTNHLFYVSPANGTTPETAADYWAPHLGVDLGLVAVDLAAPRTSILAAFTKWLEGAQSARVSAVSSADLKQWVEAKVLQYIDITQFLAANDLSMTQSQLGKILFEEDSDGADLTERLRKTTRRHAQRIMAASFLNAFAGQLGQPMKDQFRHEVTLKIVPE